METDRSFSSIVFDPRTIQQMELNGGSRPPDADAILHGAIGQLADPSGYTLSHVVEAQSHAESAPAQPETTLLARARNIAGYVGNLVSGLLTPDPRSVAVDRHRDNVMRQSRIPRFQQPPTSLAFL